MGGSAPEDDRQRPESWAKRGQIRLSAELLDKGRESDSDRKTLRKALGGYAWLPHADSVSHAHRGAERFASTFAGAYWQSLDNSMRPRSAADEAGAMRPAQFRGLLARVLA